MSGHAPPVDMLDVAYIALGAKQALIDATDDVGDSGAGGGELEYMQACIDHAPLLDQVSQEVVGTFHGVWCYEVAEPFGYALGRHLRRGGSASEAERILYTIVAASLASAMG